MSDELLPRRAFNVAETAHMLGISDRQVRRLIAAGRLAAVNTATSTDTAPHWVIPVEALNDFLAAAHDAVEAAR